MPWTIGILPPGWQAGKTCSNISAVRLRTMDVSLEACSGLKVANTNRKSWLVLGLSGCPGQQGYYFLGGRPEKHFLSDRSAVRPSLRTMCVSLEARSGLMVATVKAG